MTGTDWVVRVAQPDELPACLAIRHEVFVDGQNVPEDLEVDGRDEMAVHFLALAGTEPVATARFRVTQDGQARAERVAVRAPYRGLGLGKHLMEAIETEAQRRGYPALVLSAQVSVMGFYAARGYEAYGPEFMDAGIPHRAMRLNLSST